MNTSQPSTSDEGSSALGWPNDVEALTVFTFAHVFSSEKRAMELCTTIGMLPDRKSTPPPSCPKCQGAMGSKSSKDNLLKFTYRCRNATVTLSGANSAKKAKTTSKACSGSMSPLRNTFFEGVRISVLKVIRLMHSWLLRLPVSTAGIECEVAHRTAVDFYRFFREVAQVHVSHMQLKIGGPGKTVEVDETFTRRRKYNRGRMIESRNITLFGIFCRETKEGLYWHVRNKSQAVLWSCMYDYIEPGSTIVSDSAPQYSGCEQLGFATHIIVNHKVRGPRRSVSQNIETRHRHLKDTIKSAKDDCTLDQYIAEYTYRERHLQGLVRSGEKLLRFMKDVAAVYPGPGQSGLELQVVGVEAPSADDGPHILIEHRSAHSDNDDTQTTESDDSQ